MINDMLFRDNYWYVTSNGNSSEFKKIPFRFSCYRFKWQNILGKLQILAATVVTFPIFPQLVVLLSAGATRSVMCRLLYMVIQGSHTWKHSLLVIRTVSTCGSRMSHIRLMQKLFIDVHVDEDYTCRTCYTIGNTVTATLIFTVRMNPCMLLLLLLKVQLLTLMSPVHL